MRSIGGHPNGPSTSGPAAECLQGVSPVFDAASPRNVLKRLWGGKWVSQQTRSAVQNMFTRKSTGVPQECLPDISQKCFALWRIFGLDLIWSDKALFLDWCNGKSFRTGWALQPFTLRGWREKMAGLASVDNASQRVRRLSGHANQPRK